MKVVRHRGSSCCASARRFVHGDLPGPGFTGP
jgi:hypothetical protein